MISIITPVYNGEQFIESCIKVVIAQQCTDLEHIIIDGGSKDATVDVIKRYAESHTHIRWISEKDQGQSDAMNKGIAMAKGNILNILNADDYYEPNVLNRILEIFKALPESTLLVGNCNVWEDENKLLEVNKPKKLKFTDFLLGPCATSYPLNPSAYFYHTSAHQKIGFYDVDEHYAMDIDFLFRAAYAISIVYIDEVLGNYRKFQGTKTVNDIENGQNIRRIENLIKIYRKKLPLFQQWYVTAGYKLESIDSWRRIKYFLINPRALVPSINKKLANLI